MKKIKLLPLVGILIFLLCIVSGGVNALSMGGVGIIPSQNKESRDWFILTLRQGETINDSVVVSNTSNVKQSITMGAYDTELSETGAFGLSGPGSEQKTIGKWIKLGIKSLSLEPNEEKRVKFTLTVPKDTPDEEYSGGITAQMTPKELVGSSGTMIATRVATRVYVTVKSNLSRADKVLVQKLKGRILLQVESMGEAWYIDPVSLKRIYLADGASAYQLLRDKGMGMKNSDLEKIPIGMADIEKNNPVGEWKLYMDKIHGFSFYYPESWKIIKPSAERMEMGDIVFLQDPGAQKIDSAVDNGYIYTIRISKQQSNNTVLQDLGEIMVGNKKGQQIIFNGISSSSRYGVRVNNESMYDILFDFAWDKTQMSRDEKKVLSTFKFFEKDADSDGLSDRLEKAIGTDPNKPDSDGDGFSDYNEINGGYSPLGSGKLKINKNFANKFKGKILLQIESRGEAWYINPADGKRYYLANGEAAYQVMKYLGLGVKNKDLKKITLENLVFTQASFEQILKNLGDSKRISISNSQSVNKYGCQIEGKYLARRHDENEYVLGQSSYMVSTDEAVCQEKNIKPVYMENYWIGDDTYVRLNDNDNFYKSDKNLIQQEKRIDTYLKNEYYAPGMLKLKSWSRKGNQIIAVAGVASTMGKSENIITIDATSKKVISDSFKVEIPQMEYIATGRVDFSYDPGPISPPQNITDSPFISNDADLILSFVEGKDNNVFKHFSIETASTTLSLNDEDYIEGIVYDVYSAGQATNLYSYCRDEDKKNKPCSDINKEIKGLFEEIKKLIDNPYQSFCSVSLKPENENRQEKFRDSIYVLFSGQPYFTGNPASYIAITFSLKQEDNFEYSIVYGSNSGGTACFRGNTDGVKLNSIIEKFNKYDDKYLSDKLESSGSNWQNFLNTTSNVNKEQEILGNKDNWKTYASKKTGLTMRYPNIYEVSDSENENYQDTTTTFAMFFETGNAPTSSLAVMSDSAGKTSMAISSVEEGSVLNEKIQDTYNRLYKSYLDLFNTENLTINGIEALKIISKTPKTLEDAITKSVIFNHGKYIHSFTFTNFGSDFYLEILKTITFN